MRVRVKGSACGVCFRGSACNRHLGGYSRREKATINLEVPFPFFPGILLFRKPSNTQGKQPVFENNDG